MIKRILQIVMLCVGCAFMMYSCKSSQSSTTNTTTKAERAAISVAENKLGEIVAGYGDWETVAVSGKVAVGGLSSTIRVQMVRGESVSVSIRPFLGIEIGKAMIKGDSVYIMDKMNRRYLIRRISDISQGMNVDVSSIQDMLMNRVFTPNGEIGRVGKSFDVNQVANSSYWSATPKSSKGGLAYKFTFNDMNLVEMMANPSQSPEMAKLQMKYADFTSTKYGVIASKVNLLVDAAGKSMGLNVTVNGSSIVYDSAITEDFKIGSNYTPMSGSSLLNMVKNYL